MQADVVVLGGGVVGLACARVLAQAGRAVYLVEPERGLGRGTSSRNSGVLHAGLYYPRDSWKARLCVSGARQLSDYCDARGVPHERSGKWVLAADADEAPALGEVARSARESGALVEWVTGAELLRAEPTLRAHAGLWSPSSGVVDVPSLVAALWEDAHAAGAQQVLGQRASALARDQDGWTLTLARDPAREHPTAAENPAGSETVRARSVVNACGHDAPALARLAGVDLAARGLTPRFYRGDYMSLAARAPRPRCALVYPLPQQHGLGVHLTRDLGGQVRAGPDAYRVETPDTRLSRLSDQDWSHKAERFATALRRYLPGVEAAHLSPDFAGVRPKLLPTDGSASDFVLLGPADTGAPGLVHLLGIESPGLTACLAIAEWVATQLESRTTRS